MTNSTLQEIVEAWIEYRVTHTEYHRNDVPTQRFVGSAEDFLDHLASLSNNEK